MESAAVAASVAEVLQRERDLIGLEAELSCPVTQKLLEEPVTLDSGHSLSFTAAAQRLIKVPETRTKL